MTLDSRRLGATLSEILISVLVMSIGVVSLATLFPISVLRSIQASQLTNATIHRLNAEERIALFPRLVHDPDFDGNLAEHETAGTLDNPNGDGVNEGRFIVDPIGATGPNLTLAQRVIFGNDNGTPVLPAANPIPRYHGGFFATLWKANRAYPAGSIVAGSIGQHGYLFQTAAGGTSGATEPAWWPAPIPPATNPTPNPPIVGNNYVDGGITWVCVGRSLAAVADDVSYLEDAWQLASKGSPAAFTATSLTAATGVDMTQAATALASGSRVRVVVYGPNGRSSVVREHTPTNELIFAGQTVSWTVPVPFASISRFRVEISDPRYSFLLTVRKMVNPASLGRGSASVDVVVFHKRGTTVANEQVYVTTNNGFLQANNNRLQLNLAAGSPKPFLKKGGFIFDNLHAHWYRISHVTDETTLTPTITIDRPAVRASNRFMTMPGVVDVFPIGSVAFDSTNAP